MNADSTLPLEEQHRLIREKLQAQRRVIADELGPATQSQDGYPRSNIMRFLTRRPDLAVTVIAELAALFAGGRHARAVTTALAISRIVRSAAFNGSGRARTERPSA